MRCIINRVILFALLCALLAGCRRSETVVVIPTLSPTPRSTPLPPIPTRVAVGSSANPIQLAIVTDDSDSAAALAETLAEATDLALEPLTVAQPSEALAALCASASGTPTMVWVDGLTALAARAQGCGEIALAVEREGSTTRTYRLIANGDIEAIEGLPEQTFCRVSVTDRDTWLYPSLLLDAAGVDITTFEAVEDYEDVDALIAAVLEGDCASAGVPTDSLEALSNSERRNLTLLDNEVSIPYGVLVYPQAIPLGAREALDSAFLALVDDEAGAEMAQSLLGADALRPADDVDFESLEEVIAATGLDLAQMGR